MGAGAGQQDHGLDLGSDVMGVESSVPLAGGKGCKSSSRRHLPVNTTLKPAGPIPGLSRPGTVSARQGGRGNNAPSLLPAGAGD